MNIERIVWRDHHGTSNNSRWEYNEIQRRIEAGYKMETIGHVVAENEEEVVLAQTKVLETPFDTEDCTNWVAIVKVQIIEREVLKEDA